MKKIILLMVIFLGTTSIVYGKEEVYPGLEHTEKYSTIINDIIFDTDLEIANSFLPDNLVTHSAAIQNINWDKAIQFFCADIPCIYEADGTSENENGEKYPFIYHEFANGNMVSAGYGYFTYSTSFFYRIYNCFHLGVNEKMYSTVSDLPFETSSSAFQKITDQFSTLEYFIDDAYYTCFSLDYQTLQAQENIVYADAQGLSSQDLKGNEYEYNTDWSSADNCYYFYIGQLLQGLPVYYGSGTFPGDSLENMPVQVLYSKDGIERIDLGTPSGFYTFTEQNNPVILKSFDDIAQTVANKYGNLLTESTYTVTRAKLYQVPVKQKDSTYNVRPAWLFEITEEGIYEEMDNQAYHYTLYTIVDAQTGEELAI